MSSTFFGLSIAASGLNTAQAQINTTANNIANVETDGYSRQKVNTVASSALRCYQKYGTTGTGVEAVSVTQCRDLYYDEKYWNNESRLGYYEKKLYYMNQIQGYFNENTSKTGFSTVYTKMFNSLSTLQTNPGDSTVRKEFISNANDLMEYFNTTATSLSSLQKSINDEIKTAVDEVNAIAEKISILNKQINVIEQGGGHANELRDQRALLFDDLSNYSSVTITEVPVKNSKFPEMDTGATYCRVDLAGQILVDGYEYNTLSVKARDKDGAYNQSDESGLYDIVWTAGGDTFNPCTSANQGTLKAMMEVRDGNNCENTQGYVSDANSTEQTITISGDALTTELNELNLPASGTIWVDSKEFKYDSFEMETSYDAETGKTSLASVTFHIDEDTPLSGADASDITGRKLEVGKSINYMGIPYYQNQLNLFVRNFCELFNNIEKSGVDANGDAMGAFFVFYDKTDSTEYACDAAKTIEQLILGSATDTEIVGRTGNNKIKSDSKTEYTYHRLTASNCRVNAASAANPKLFAVTTKENFNNGQDASDLVLELEKLYSENKEVFKGGGGDAFLQCIYADVTVDTQECEIFTENFTNIQKSISQQRQSISGVDEDEEALDLVKFQNAYNLASKCISVMSEIYDRLILQTGV